MKRRTFLKSTAATGVAATAMALDAKTYAQAQGANERIGLAFLGVGGRCQQHIDVILALQRANAKRAKRRFLAFPILLAQFFDALRSDVDGVSPELDRRVREGLDRFLESAGSSETEPESERVSFACPTPSIQITAPAAWSMTARPVLGLLRGGVAIMIVIGYLLQGAPLDEPSPEPRRAQSIPALAVIEPAEPNRDAGATAPPLSANGSRRVSGELLPKDTQGVRSSSAPDPWKGASSSESRQLIDLARVASRTRDAHAALALLAQHARSFPGKDAKDRRKVWQLVCASPAARSATECVNPPPSPAPPPAGEGGT